MQVLAISGSLREKSFNTYLLRAARELAPPDMHLEIVGLAAMPPYNEDVREQGFPPTVEDFRRRIQEADAILIASPEYNYSIPGVLKNAIDWASRPPAQPFDGKPLALMGASPSAFGAGRAQHHLRQVFIYLDAKIVNRPEVMVSNAPMKFDTDGRLVDESTRRQVTALLAALEEWTIILKKGKEALPAAVARAS